MMEEKDCDIFEKATFDDTFFDETREVLVHYILDASGFQRFKNPNGRRFFGGIYESDRMAARVIKSIADFVQDDNKGDAFDQLRGRLQAYLPVREGVKYVMTYEQAYFVAKSCRLMDDIYVISERENGEWYLVDYVSGAFAS